MAIGRSTLDLLADLPSMQCIMGYILWDVFDSHFGFFKKKVGISFYFWIIRLVNSQLALYSHVRCNPLNTPRPLNTPQMTIRDFNSDSSYLPSLTCNMDVRVHIGRSTGRSTPQDWHLVAKNGNFRFLLLQLI